MQVGKQPSPMLQALAKLNFPLVITTNYDQLFEGALAAAGKQETGASSQHSDTAQDCGPALAGDSFFAGSYGAATITKRTSASLL